MSEREGFLSRWSRRKREVRSVEEEPQEALSARAESGAAEGAPAIASSPEETESSATSAELGPEEIAKLPRLEDLTAETDISMFLRKGVPEPLRNAALRKMWSLDPKIRDFLSEAREYAYDWNTPGGVPGSGALPSTEDVARLAARIVGAPSGKPEAAGARSQDREQLSFRPPDGNERSADAAQASSAPISEQRAPQKASEQGNIIAPPPTAPVATNSDTVAAAQPSPADEPVKPASVRRHGGAMPL